MTIERTAEAAEAPPEVGRATAVVVAAVVAPTTSQRALLHLAVVVAAAAAFVPGAVALVTDVQQGAALPRASIWFAPLIGPALAVLVTDRWWAMSPRTAAAERRTLRARSAGHRLVRLNRLLSRVVWLAGIGLGVLFWAVGP